MAITIRCTRLKVLTVNRNDKGSHDIQGTYELISTTDKVLASQGFNGYNDLKIELSYETRIALEKFLANLSRDIGNATGTNDDPPPTAA